MASNGGFQSSTGYSSQPNIDIDQERTSDPASSSFFGTDFRRHDDLREMLDSSEDRKKLEAMKRIIGMVAKGRDASALFPAVVKNVVCKNIEVKKLVYVYLTRYAEEQQDLALLSIATFQRSMKDPNQLIRASALRVLSSIRIPVIVPIMMLVIKDGVNDMSPYVRKAAAHAIPKLYSVDADQKEELISFLEKLLADKTTLVIGSAIQAFEELCPERIDLIHKNFRKLCSLLADVEEWGQIIILNMLTRYARTQFINPNQEGITDLSAEPDKPFYSSSNDSSEEEDDGKPVYAMDPDHRLLLRAAKPLLNSRNAAVVMAVVQLYYHCAPKSEVSLVSRAMIRLLRSHKEVQFIVLSTIATMALNKPGMFEPYIKSFYILANDPSHIKLLKLEILTCLATESNVSVMMREFQQYVISPEKDFAAAAIQAIGKIASEINDITDSCLGGLISLLSNKSDVVVAESVVVIKKLLQMKKSGHKDIISHLTQILDDITLPNAKASILWLIGEYCDKVPKLAPDVLRKAAKNFVNEEDIVKLQTLNLASKLCITNSKQTQLLVQYAFNLAKYDQSYDIRDRARFLRALIIPPEENAGALAKHAKKIFLADKPAPVVESRHKERDQYQLGTLSHAINGRAHGYYELPNWPEVAPDPTVRNVVEPKSMSNTVSVKKSSKPEKEKGFYDSTSQEETDEDSEEETDEEESGEEESGSEGGESDSDEESEEEDDSDLESEEDNSSEEEEDSEEDSSEVAGSDSDSSIDIPVKNPPSTAIPFSVSDTTSKPASQIMDLFEIDNSQSEDNKPDVMEPTTPVTPTLEEPLYNIISAEFTPDVEYELLNRMNSGGLHVTYSCTRSPHIYNEKMVGVQLTFTNHSESSINNIRIAEQKLQEFMSIHEFPEISEIEPTHSTTVTLGVDYNDTLQPAVFDIKTSDNSYHVKIEPVIGELLRPVTMSQQHFNIQRGKLSGMNEYKATIEKPKDPASMKTSILKLANVGTVQSDDTDTLSYAAQTLSGSSLVLIQIKTADQADVTVNCDKMVVGSMLLKELKENLSVSED